MCFFRLTKYYYEMDYRTSVDCFSFLFTKEGKFTLPYMEAVDKTGSGTKRYLSYNTSRALDEVVFTLSNLELSENDGP